MAIFPGSGEGTLSLHPPDHGDSLPAEDSPLSQDVKPSPWPQSALSVTATNSGPTPSMSSRPIRSGDRDVGQSKILLCEFCDASFTSSGGLSLHKTSVHLQRRFVCKVCGKVLKRKETLKNHMLTHVGVNAQM